MFDIRGFFCSSSIHEQSRESDAEDHYLSVSPSVSLQSTYCSAEEMTSSEPFQGHGDEARSKKNN